VNYDHIQTTDDSSFVEEATGFLLLRMQQSIDEYGKCILGLSGGSTPKPIYEELGHGNLDWSKVYIFLVDDRYVAADDDDSNQKLVRETLLKNCDIPESNLIFPNTEVPLEDCITDYEQRLAQLLSEGIPHMITLGMGDDGHIASLFPPVSDRAFTDHLVIHTQTEKFAVKDRISSTFVVLLSATDKIFFLKGDAKKAVWDEMLESEEEVDRWPAKAVLKMGGVTVVSDWKD